ncbi:MAG: methyl-accepting chemotaxis protein [Elusimicrobia bacterium]|jgi:methyl-accepting chemotaxis protein|nr:methyl-accepting chemotaxis protein [Elusimicrobiota bacterium]
MTPSPAHTSSSSKKDPFQPPRIKRKIVIIKRGMQMKFVMLVSLFVLIAITAIGLDFYFHFGREVQNFMDPSLYELFKSDSYVFLLKLVLYMIGVTIFAVLASHKLAGPIYRFERSARTVSSGDLTHRVRLRAGDELEDFRDEFNTMVESLQRLVSQDAHVALRVSKQLADLLDERKSGADLQHRLEQVKADVDHLHKGFKI